MTDEVIVAISLAEAIKFEQNLSTKALSAEDKALIEQSLSELRTLFKRDFKESPEILDLVQQIETVPTSREARTQLVEKLEAFGNLSAPLIEAGKKIQETGQFDIERKEVSGPQNTKRTIFRVIYTENKKASNEPAQEPSSAAEDSKPEKRQTLVHAQLKTPSQNLPFPSLNNAYKGHSELLEELSEQLKSVGTSVLITHSPIQNLFNGYGKTRLAIELGWQMFSQQKRNPVYFVSGDSLEQLELDLTALAAPEFLDLDEGASLDQKSKLIAVKQWLSEHKNWLLIIDSIEGKGVFDYIKEHSELFSSGNLILTSSSKEGKSFVNYTCSL